MKRYSLQELSGKYKYVIDGETHYAYGACRNSEIANCEAKNIKEAIEILQKHCPVKLDETGYGTEEFFSYCICEEFNPIY